MIYPRFFDFFRDYEDAYVLIGGNAASILLEQAGLSARATTDYDLIVIFENVTQAFVDRLKMFLKANHYQLRGRDETPPRAHYYRFVTTPNGEVPVMIELFSHAPIDFDLADPASRIIPLPDESESLSAINLDADYYQVLRTGVEHLAGIGSVLRPEYLILFKAKAQLDVDERRKLADSPNHSRRNKHKADIFQLLQIIDVDHPVDAHNIPLSVKKDFAQFIESLEGDSNLGREITQLNIPLFKRGNRQNKALAIQMLRSLII